MLFHGHEEENIDGIAGRLHITPAGTAYAAFLASEVRNTGAYRLPDFGARVYEWPISLCKMMRLK